MRELLLCGSMLIAVAVVCIWTAYGFGQAAGFERGHRKGFNAGVTREVALENALLEAARLMQGPVPPDEQDDPARVFWTLFSAALPHVDAINPPPRPNVTLAKGGIRK